MAIAQPSNPREPEPDGSSTPTPTSESARDIARVAARLFASKGYDATSVSTIVGAAGVTKPTLYYHFGSKEGLAQAILFDPLKNLHASMRGLLESEPDPIRSLIRMIEANVEFCRDDPDRARFAFAVVFGPLGTGLADKFMKCGDDIEGLWDDAARRLARAGVIDPARCENFALSVRGLIMVHIIDFLFCDQEPSSDLARRLVNDLLLGFGTSKNHVLPPPGEIASCPRHVD